MKYWAGDQTLEINMRDRAQLFDEIRLRFDTGTGFALATLNMDHLVKIGSDPAFAAAYADHDLIVADGRPVVWLSRLAGQPVALLPGSDLVEPLCGLAEECDVAVALVGSDAATLEAATAALCARMPGLRVALCVSPPMGFDPDGAGADDIFTALNGASVGLCLLALGAPKQERLAARGRDMAPGTGFASIGAGLDFLAGTQARAPRWVRAIALEWLWRALSQPRRLVPRYARCFAILPRQVVNAVALRRQG